MYASKWTHFQAVTSIISHRFGSEKGPTAKNNLDSSFCLFSDCGPIFALQTFALVLFIWSRILRVCIYGVTKWSENCASHLCKQNNDDTRDMLRVRICRFVYFQQGFQLSTWLVCDKRCLFTIRFLIWLYFDGIDGNHRNRHIMNFSGSVMPLLTGLVNYIAFCKYSLVYALLVTKILTFLCIINMSMQLQRQSTICFEEFSWILLMHILLWIIFSYLMCFYHRISWFSQQIHIYQSVHS